MIFRLKIVVIFFVFFTIGKGQQLPIFSNYIINGTKINPSMAGYDGLTTFSLTGRQQWLGYENAPRTFLFTSQTRLLYRNFIIKSRPNKKNKFIPARSGRVGLGFNIYGDRNGYFSNSGIAFTYAYHIPFLNSQMSLGVQTVLSQYKVDQKGIQFRYPEYKFENLYKPSYCPDVNVGFFYTNFTKYYIGFSVCNILQSNIKFGNNELSNYKIIRHYYIASGYKYYDNFGIEYEPSVLIKTTEFLQTQMDLTIKCVFEGFWAGLSYRTLKTMVAHFGMQWKNYFLTYAFDFDFNAFQRFSYGSHELTVSMRFGETSRRKRLEIRY